MRSASCPGRFNQVDSPGPHCIGGWVGLGAGKSCSQRDLKRGPSNPWRAVYGISEHLLTTQCRTPRYTTFIPPISVSVLLQTVDLRWILGARSGLTFFSMRCSVSSAGTPRNRSSHSARKDTTFAADAHRRHSRAVLLVTTRKAVGTPLWRPSQG